MDNVYFKDAETFYDEMAQPIKGEVNTDSKSLTYRQNMPVAQELSYITMLLDEVNKRVHAKTALENNYDDDLIEKCKDMGVVWNKREKATTVLTITGNPNATLPAGSNVSTKSGLVFITTQDCTILDDGTAKVNAEAFEEGSKYNVKANEICKFSIAYSGILTVNNENDVTNGYDDETMQHLYDRYFERVSMIVTSGNTNYYVLKAKNVTGVGDVKGYECKNESGVYQEGHALLVITNSNNRQADAELISRVENNIEKNRFMGAKIHVISASELSINISCKLVVESMSLGIDKLKEVVEGKLQEYFKNLKLGTEYVSIGRINSEIFNSSSDIIDVRELKLNNETSNIDIPVNTIAVFGTLSITEV